MRTQKEVSVPCHLLLDEISKHSVIKSSAEELMQLKSLVQVYRGQAQWTDGARVDKWRLSRPWGKSSGPLGLTERMISCLPVRPLLDAGEGLLWNGMHNTAPEYGRQVSHLVHGRSISIWVQSRNKNTRGWSSPVSPSNFSAAWTCNC